MADMATEGAVGGLAQGAATGAALGSVVPGIGTAVGAVVGGLAGGIMGFLGGEDAQDQANANAAITMMNYNAKIQDANNSLLIGSLNAANARKDAEELQKQWGYQQEAFDENQKVIDAHFSYVEQGLGLEEGRLESRQTATFGAAGASVGVGTPVEQKMASQDLFKRTLGSMEQEHKQQDLGNALKEQITATEFQSQIEKYTGEAEAYTTAAAGQAKSDYMQAQIELMKGGLVQQEAQSQAFGSMVGGITGGAKILATNASTIFK
jgi:hypothetical protein